ALAILSLSGFALAQQKPDAGQVLQQSREPFRLPPPSEPDLAPRPPEPKPALGAQPKLRVKVAQFTFTGNTIYTEAELRTAVQEYIGKELDFDGLNEAATKARAYYRSRGYFLAQAYLPQQAIRGGSVQIGIIEGRVGQLELDRNPNSNISTRLLAGIIGAHLTQGDVITETGLERPLLLINDLPTAQVISEIRPSRTVGAADLRVNVDKGSNPVDGYLDFDNQGSRFTGEFRTGGNLNVNTPLGWGDQFTFRGFRSSGMWYARVAYLVPVTYYGTRLGFSYTEFDYTLGKQFAPQHINGEGEVGSVYAFHPIVRTRNTNAILQTSYEEKRLTDKTGATGALEFRDIRTTKLGLVGDWRDGILSGGLNAYSTTYTRGRVSIDPSAIAQADDTGHRTAGSFHKFNLEARRLQRLSENANLLLAYVGQKASKNLTSSERLSLGGPGGVRAYPVGEASGHSGHLVQLEARYIWPGFKVFEGDFTVFGFYDVGRIKANEQPIAADVENYRSISGYGAGLSLGKEGSFSLRVSFAFRYGKEEPQTDTAGQRDPRIWLQAVKWF
ncbi:MAG TPA: ShlB/FhaC/HecB family hemolysin secretion/activation protein, partial [Planctomycetota bacterium]|nr:ShlB/FhaC/HecB family hemolysin secretion/activation protein [Planctomycetota bacterium]